MPDQDRYLDIRNVDAGYGRSQVLFGVTMAVPWRGGVAILGRNGAGKTTLMKAIVGELPLLGGAVSLDGRSIGALPTEQRIRLGLGYVPQEHSVFGRLSVRDNLAVGGETAQAKQNAYQYRHRYGEIQRARQCIRKDTQNIAQRRASTYRQVDDLGKIARE